MYVFYFKSCTRFDKISRLFYVGMAMAYWVQPFGFPVSVDIYNNWLKYTAFEGVLPVGSGFVI